MTYVPNNKKGHLPFGHALKARKGKRTNGEFAEELGLVENTLLKIYSGTIRPGVPTMQKIVRLYPELYDLGMEAFFGRRPRRVAKPPKGVDPHLAFTRALKDKRGNTPATQFAASLGISILTYYEFVKEPPKLSTNPEVFCKVVAAYPDLYDLAATVYFGRRPRAARSTWSARQQWCNSI